LKTHGAKTVSVVGGSFGGGAAGDASIKSGPGEIDRIVFLGAAPNLPAESSSREHCSSSPEMMGTTAAHGFLAFVRSTKKLLSRRN
jgi:hypothetical protein